MIIKYRGLNRASNEWKYGYFIIDEKYAQIWQEGDVPVIVDLKTAGPCTGIKDKKGTEIYQGDIVRSSIRHEIGECVFEKGRFMIKFRRNIYLTFMAENRTSLRVLGNIYENPELLEEKK